jgi:hypothetical protein
VDVIAGDFEHAQSTVAQLSAAFIPLMKQNRCHRTVAHWS